MMTRRSCFALWLTVFLLNHSSCHAFVGLHTAANFYVAGLRRENVHMGPRAQPLFFSSSQQHHHLPPFSPLSSGRVFSHLNLSVSPFELLLGSSSSLSPTFSSLTESLFSFQGPVPLLPSFALNALLFGLLQNKLRTMLTPAGFLHALALGTFLWSTLGWRGWTTAVSYLFLGQFVTKVRFADKERRGLAEGRGGRRGPENVWGSAATALMCATAAAAASVQGPAFFLGVGASLYQLGFVASLATKLADTFASEIGKAYGKTTFLITTLERAEPGTEGAVSLEGTVAAMVGGLILSMYGYSIGLLDSLPAVAVSTTAAFFATNIESLLGATLQGKQGLEWVSNEVINFWNTLIGAATAMALGKALLGLT